ncbi:MAG: site-specific integrase, partial [Bdellovibrionota bacterium]
MQKISLEKSSHSRHLKLKGEHQKWLGQFIESLAQTNKSANTIHNYYFDLVLFLEWYEQFTPSLILKIQTTHINSYLQYLLGNEEWKDLSKPKTSAFLAKILHALRRKNYFKKDLPHAPQINQARMRKLSV